MRAVAAQLLSQGNPEQAQEPGPAVEADEPPPSPIRVQCRLASAMLEPSAEWLTRHASEPGRVGERVLFWEDAEIGARVWARNDP